MSLWVFIDVSYLMNRRFYAMGGGKSDDGPGATYGFFQDILDLRAMFGPERFVFAFDAGYDYRREIYPGYKQRDRTEEELQAKAMLAAEIKALRNEHLPALGYANLLWQPGYEADDMLAAAVAALPERDEAVIVSADEDLWQLIGPTVWCYSPKTKKAVTLETFRREWGIDPPLWAQVKAMAGCSSDKIPGIVGIGEGSAAKWYAGRLKQCEGKPKKDGTPCRCKYCLISKAGLDIHNRNIKLTRLPAPGTMTPVWRQDTLDAVKWNKVVAGLNFRALLDMRFPWK